MVKNWPLILILVGCLGCAQTNYLWEQGIGQFKLQNRAKDNKKVLDDPNYPEANKQKIRQIQAYKDYFYRYFEKSPAKIYSRMTELEGEAVTYLVIASPRDEIKAKETCFPFMGCFPYLGFFKESSAVEYQKKLEDQGLVTYKRPVYAYSTLGYFEDTILSSFFKFDEEELAELIFHELFHTIFFAKNDVDFNEALASYFGVEMAKEYFFKIGKMKPEKIEKLKKSKEDLAKLVATLAQELELQYEQQKLNFKTENLSGEDSDLILKSFLDKRFYPTFLSFCKKHELNAYHCFPLRYQWNNASFAAFLTYEKDIDFIDELKRKNDFSLKALLDFVQHSEKEYQAYSVRKKREVFRTHEEQLRLYYSKYQSSRPAKVKEEEIEEPSLRLIDYFVLKGILKSGS